MLNMLIHYVHRLQVYQADSPLRIIQVSNFFNFENLNSFKCNSKMYFTEIKIPEY